MCVCQACAPLQQFERVCEELSSALQREQRAQALLHDQASQLQQLGLSMELHTGEELEKDRTLAQAVQVHTHTHTLWEWTHVSTDHNKHK